MSFESGSSKGRLEILDKPKLKKRFSNQVPFQFSKALEYRVSKPISQKAISRNSLIDKRTCSKCGKKHRDECLVGKRNWFRCGKEVYKVRGFPNVKGQEMSSDQEQPSGSNVDSQRKNCFYALYSRGVQESSPDVVTGLL